MLYSDLNLSNYKSELIDILTKENTLNNPILYHDIEIINDCSFV